MSIRDDYRTYLLTKSGVTDLVGTGDDARVYPGFLPQGVTLPAIVLVTVSDVPSHDMDGANTWTVARVEVACYAASAPGADALVEAVRMVSDGKSGTTMGGSTVFW